MPQNWTLNPGTGDYVLAGGNPVQTDDLLTPSYIRLKVRRQQWMYGPNDKYGSDFWKLKNQKRQSDRQISTMEAAAARALQPMADDGRAQSVTITLSATARGAIGLEADILQANGQEQTLNLPSIGV